MNLVMHLTGAAAVLIMCIAGLVGIAAEARRPRVARPAMLVLAALSLTVFSVGQYLVVVGG